MTQIWLWIGVIGMALGAAFFGFGAHNAKTERWKILFILNFFITAIAAGLYLAMALGQGVSVKQAFRRLVTVHLVLWTAYPIVWILSNTGLNIVSDSGQTMLFTLLDLASKVGFGFLSLNTMHTLEQARQMGEPQVA